VQASLESNFRYYVDAYEKFPRELRSPLDMAVVRAVRLPAPVKPFSSGRMYHGMSPQDAAAIYQHVGGHPGGYVHSTSSSEHDQSDMSNPDTSSTTETHVTSPDRSFDEQRPDSGTLK
jgi:hypothetical protein